MSYYNARGPQRHITVWEPDPASQTSKTEPHQQGPSHAAYERPQQYTGQQSRSFTPEPSKSPFVAPEESAAVAVHPFARHHPFARRPDRPDAVDSSHSQLQDTKPNRPANNLVDDLLKSIGIENSQSYVESVVSYKRESSFSDDRYRYSESYHDSKRYKETSPDTINQSFPSKTTHVSESYYDRERYEQNSEHAGTQSYPIQPRHVAESYHDRRKYEKSSSPVVTRSNTSFTHDIKEYKKSFPDTDTKPISSRHYESKIVDDRERSPFYDFRSKSPQVTVVEEKKSDSFLDKLDFNKILGTKPAAGDHKNILPSSLPKLQHSPTISSTVTTDRDYKTKTEELTSQSKTASQFSSQLDKNIPQKSDGDVLSNLLTNESLDMDKIGLLLKNKNMFDQLSKLVDSHRSVSGTPQEPQKEKVSIPTSFVAEDTEIGSTDKKASETSGNKNRNTETVSHVQLSDVPTMTSASIQKSVPLSSCPTAMSNQQHPNVSKPYVFMDNTTYPGNMSMGQTSFNYYPPPTFMSTQQPQPPIMFPAGQHYPPNSYNIPNSSYKPPTVTTYVPPSTLSSSQITPSCDRQRSRSPLAQRLSSPISSSKRPRNRERERSPWGGDEVISVKSIVDAKVQSKSPEKIISYYTPTVPILPTKTTISIPDCSAITEQEFKEVQRRLSDIKRYRASISKDLNMLSQDLVNLRMVNQSISIRDDLIKKNSKLEKQMKAVEQSLADEYKKLLPFQTALSQKFNMEETQASTNIRYEDRGDHWCEYCQELFPTLAEVISHMHSDKHMKEMVSNNESSLPWKMKFSKKLQVRRSAKPAKGYEFFSPCNCFYCIPCKSFFGDEKAIHRHLELDEHNKCYKVYCEENPDHERLFIIRKDKEIKRIEEERRKAEDKKRIQDQIERQRRNEFLMKRAANDARHMDIYGATDMEIENVEETSIETQTSPSLKTSISGGVLSRTVVNSNAGNQKSTSNSSSKSDSNKSKSLQSASKAPIDMFSI